MWPRAVFTCSINVSWLTCYKQRWKSERKKVIAVCYRQNTLSHFSDKNKKKVFGNRQSSYKGLYWDQVHVTL